MNPVASAGTRRFLGPGRAHGRPGAVLARLLPAVLLAVLALAAGPGRVAAADPGTLRVDPPTQNVSSGQTFVVNVIQSAQVVTTGAQVNLTINPKLVQVKDFELGPAYTSANAIFAFGNADMGSSGNKAATLERVNKFGTLENVSGFLLPGGGTIPAGDAVFLKITLVAQPGDGGPMNLSLSRGSMIDQNGQPLDLTVTNGALVVAGGGTAPGSQPPGSGAPGSPAPGSASPGPSAEPTPSGEPSPSPSVEPTPAPSSPTTPVAVRVAPTSLTLKKDDQARVFLIANSAGDISSADADLAFDPNKLQVLAVEAGTAWAGSTLIASPTGATRGVDGAITEANASGVLHAVGAFLSPGASDLPYGEGTFVSVVVKAKADGTSVISIDKAAVLGVAGESLGVTIDPASLTKPPEKGLEIDPSIVIALVVLLVLIVGVVVIVRSGRIPVRVRRRWPFYLSFVLGLVPVALFALIVGMLIANAAPVVNDPGVPALFGAQLTDANGQAIAGYSLLPPLWGTLLITLIAAAVALPIGLALAIVAVDYPMGFIGRLVRPAVGILSGVPPIVYAVSVPVFVTTFMIPKFAANMDFSQFQNGGPAAIGANPATWPPGDVPYSAGGFPWDLTSPNSVLLGGLLVGLFIIPFVTPLFVDALRDVPRAAREASLALGANRTYTLRRVILPRALPAIVGASTMAILKAMGDAVIVIFAVGLEAMTLPNPPIDVLERTSSIGAWGANLIGSLEVLDQSCSPAKCAVGYSSALLLLLAAAVVVVLLTVFQARGRRRLAV